MKTSIAIPELERWSERWLGYLRSARCSRRALVQKALFKLIYY